MHSCRCLRYFFFRIYEAKKASAVGSDRSHLHDFFVFHIDACRFRIPEDEGSVLNLSGEQVSLRDGKHFLPGRVQQFFGGYFATLRAIGGCYFLEMLQKVLQGGFLLGGVAS